MANAIEELLMRKKLIAAVLAALVLPAAAQAAATTLTTPVQADIKACDGDTIRLSGQLLTVLTATANPAGGIVFSTHFQPQGLRGVNLQTGTAYLGTGLTLDVIVVGPAAGAITFTFVNRFHIQATAGAESFDVSETMHITELADGSITAFVDNFSAACP
jgi:hypothetical protein